MSGPAHRRGILIILSSPSGAGKSTLSRRLLEFDPDVRFSISATTRPPRPGEVEGREYFFRSRRQFEAMIQGGEMLEHAEVFGNLYGTPRTPVEAAITAGRDVLFDVDWQGGQQIRNSTLRYAVVSIFILPPSIAELESRLRARGQDTAAVVAARMAKSRDEISHWAEYDYVLINENLAQCEAELRAIIQAERLRRDRRPELVGLVRSLNAEFGERLRMSLYALDGVVPELPGDGNFWVAPGARLSGRVILGAGASVWFNAVLRGDNEPIVVGAGSNVQDNCVCHTDLGHPLTIGADCTIGHMAILHGCTIGEGSLVGMGATVLNGAVIGSGVLVGAGALVTEGKAIPDGVLVVGRPGKVTRALTAEEIAGLRRSAAGYRANAARFRSGLRQA